MAPIFIARVLPGPQLREVIRKLVASEVKPGHAAPLGLRPSLMGGNPNDMHIIKTYIV